MQVGPDATDELARALLASDQPHIDWRSAGVAVQADYRAKAAGLIAACPSLARPLTHCLASAAITDWLTRGCGTSADDQDVEAQALDWMCQEDCCAENPLDPPS
jgi:hypothetical protein